MLAAPNATETESSSLDEAMGLWMGAGAFHLTRQAERLWPRLEVRFEPAPKAHLGVYDDESGVVYINRRMRGARERAITIAHELGHAFGLWHVHGSRSLMNEHNTAVGVTELDVQSVYSAWPGCLAEDTAADGRP